MPLGIHRRNQILRTIAVLSLSIIVTTLTIFYHRASESGKLGSGDIVLFFSAFAGCLYILILAYWVKAQRERTSKLNEEKYRSIIAVSRTGAWEYNAETSDLWCSREYFEMLGYNKGIFLQEHKMTIEDVWINMLHPDDRDMAVKKFTAFFSRESDGMYENTFRLRHKSGNWIWVLARSKALLRSDGTVSKVMLGAHIDITEKIAIQLELRRRNQKLLDFAFSNAHHVRGPVARMLGLVNLSKFDTERDQKWYMQTIAGEVEGLDEIIRAIARDLDEIEELA